MTNNAKITDLPLYLQAGINPKTGLPLKYGSNPETLLSDYIRIVSEADKKDAVNRYTWYNLPDGLDGKLIERILYFRGQAAFFYMKETKKFYFLPYALDGEIDVYGRFLGITPLPFNGTASTTEDNKTKPWITGLIRKPVYDLLSTKDMSITDRQNACVLLKDYTEGISQTIIPRADINSPLVKCIAECFPMLRTNMINSCGVSGMRVGSEDESASVYEASNSVYNASITGRKWVPAVGMQAFQDLGTTNTAKFEEFLLAMQSLENYRLATYGLDNGGIFQKKAQELQSEADMASTNVSLILKDGLDQRQNACDLINSIFGTKIWCEITPVQSPINSPMETDSEGEDYQDDNQEGNTSYE